MSDWRKEHRVIHEHPVFGCETCLAMMHPRYDVDADTARREARAARDRQRTVDAHRAIDKGEHPYTHRPLAGNGKTCGDCDHFQFGHRDKFFKCAHPLMPVPTGGPATDIRKTWPACDWFASLSTGGERV